MRSAVRFARKYYAAQLLSARIFQGEQAVMEVRRELEDAQFWKQGDQKMRDLVNVDSGKLQQWVRASFLCDGMATPSLKAFINGVVRPALQCNVSTVPAQMQEVLVKFTSIIAGGLADESDAAQLKIACSAINGDLARHPLISGLALQCRRMVSKESRGISTMAGRRTNESEHERALIADAGLSLAIAGANVSLAKEFGLSSTSLKLDLEELAKFSLPQPALALNWSEVMDQNFALCDQRYVRESGAPKSLLLELVFPFYFCRSCSQRVFTKGKRWTLFSSWVSFL